MLIRVLEEREDACLGISFQTLLLSLMIEISSLGEQKSLEGFLFASLTTDCVGFVL